MHFFLQNMFCRDRRTFVLRKIEPIIASVEKNDEYQVCHLAIYITIEKKYNALCRVCWVSASPFAQPAPSQIAIVMRAAPQTARKGANQQEKWGNQAGICEIKQDIFAKILRKSNSARRRFECKETGRPGSHSNLVCICGANFFAFLSNSFVFLSRNFDKLVGAHL